MILYYNTGIHRHEVQKYYKDVKIYLLFFQAIETMPHSTYSALQLLLLLLLLLFWSLEYQTPCRCRRRCPSPRTEPYHLEYLQHNLRQDGEHAADAGGYQTAGVELLESTGEHTQGVRQALHSTGQDLLQSTVDTARNIDAPVTSWEDSVRFF